MDIERDLMDLNDGHVGTIDWFEYWYRRDQEMEALINAGRALDELSRVCTSGL